MIKYLLLIFAFCSIFTLSKAQSTVIEADSTNLEVNASLLELDTSSTNIWQIGLPIKTFFGAAHSAPFAVMTDSINPYPVNNLSTFTISMDSGIWGNYPDAYLSFWHKYETDSLADGGFVELSVDSGATWVNVITAYTIGVQEIIPDNFYTESDTINGGIPAFSGKKNSWEFSKIYLQWVIVVIHENNSGQNRSLWDCPKVMFRFNFKSDSIQTNKAGWIIDNLEIGYTNVGGGIAQKNNINQFEVHVFPNPMEGQAIIQASSQLKNNEFKFNIYNTTGQLVDSGDLNKSNQFVFEKNNLNSGIYFYSVSDKGGNVKTGKLIIK